MLMAVWFSGDDDDEWRVFVIFGRRPYLYGAAAPMPSNELAQFAGVLVKSAHCLNFTWAHGILKHTLVQNSSIQKYILTNRTKS